MIPASARLDRSVQVSVMLRPDIASSTPAVVSDPGAGNPAAPLAPSSEERSVPGDRIVW